MTSKKLFQLSLSLFYSSEVLSVAPACKALSSSRSCWLLWNIIVWWRQLFLLVSTEQQQQDIRNCLSTNDLTLGYQTSDSASSSKFHNLALLVVLVSRSSNFHHWPLLCGASVALGWLSGFKFCHPIVRSLVVTHQWLSRTPPHW